MGIFFKQVERKESVKSVAIIKKIILILAMICCVIGVVSGSITLYLKVVLVLLSMISLIDGVESYIHKDEGKSYRMDFGFAALCLFWAILT